MLILTRKVNESIIIGNDIRITMLRSQGKQYRIGISAPKDIPVHRQEVYERLQASDQQPGNHHLPEEKSYENNNTETKE